MYEYLKNKAHLEEGSGRLVLVVLIFGSHGFGRLDRGGGGGGGESPGDGDVPGGGAVLNVERVGRADCGNLYSKNNC